MLFKQNVQNKILDIIEHDEKYQGKEVVNAAYILDTCQKRYELMQEILTPVVMYLKDKIDIQNAYFQSNILEMDIVLVIEYTLNSKKGYLAISYSNLIDGLQINSGLINGVGEALIKKNESLFIDTIDKGLKNNFNIEPKLFSTSNFFNFALNNDAVNITGEFKNLNDTLELSYIYQTLFDLNNLSCKTNLNDVSKKLSDLENLKKFLEHIKVYEKNLPKFLIKNK